MKRKVDKYSLFSVPKLGRLFNLIDCKVVRMSSYCCDTIWMALRE